MHMQRPCSVVIECFAVRGSKITLPSSSTAHSAWRTAYAAIAAAISSGVCLADSAETSLGGGMQKDQYPHAFAVEISVGF